LRLALKIDVDTYRGLAEGAPRLAQFLSSQKIPASFFVTLGPDTSGRAITRVFKRKGFARKMQRSHALDIYGWRTVFSGTLLPARPMGTSFDKVLRQWQAQGFEVSPHGYDHILWHDQAAAWSDKQAQAELERTFNVYRAIFHQEPKSFAAPGWQAGAGTWAALERAQLLYHSDTRGETPYFPVLLGKTLSTLEIPTTLPTWDEMLAWDGITLDTLVKRTLALLYPDILNVWTIHAELEGGVYFSQFKEFIMQAMGENMIWSFLPDVAHDLLKSPQNVPRHSIEQGERPGRAGKVTCQSTMQNEKLKIINLVEKP
jgi:undecaprenyl phosphate-alpha-L-ara4FN deformylase